VPGGQALSQEQANSRTFGDGDRDEARTARRGQSAPGKSAGSSSAVSMTRARRAVSLARASEVGSGAVIYSLSLRPSDSVK
jgi:hypothetical protein